MAQAKKSKKPNFILVFCDDIGYGDLGCFGSKKHRTPNIDKMAREGMRFTSFYSTSGVCTPSRSSLMTGCYPRRVNMHVNETGRQVLFPGNSRGLHLDEITIAELLKDLGYTTGIIGKWHLGDQQQFLPTRQGFDSYFGIPFSNDMGYQPYPNAKYPPLPLMRNEKVIETEPDQRLLTKRYTQEAIRFITKNKDNPFFLYLPHSMPHNPVYASKKFAGKSKNGKYGDAIEEIDWSMGEILRTLKRLGLDENTIVLITSDNGASNRFGGRNFPLRGFKASTWEGGMRVPMVVRWPNHIPAGQSTDAVTTTMDVLPTFVRIAGGAPPKDRVIDGHDIRELLFAKKGAESPYEAFYCYNRAKLDAVRSGPWKLYVPRKIGRGKRARTLPWQLFDLKNDIGEAKNVAKKFPQVVERLKGYLDKARIELGDGDLKGKGQRPAGSVTNPKTLTTRPKKEMSQSQRNPQEKIVASPLAPEKSLLRPNAS
ncbi:MAG: sulfatase-like hydrolase/transferase [Gemmataceae bacterium]